MPEDPRLALIPVAVYELPLQMTDGFCHQGGRPILFRNVDWFEAPLEDLTPEEVVLFIRGKVYYDPERRYLLVARCAIPSPGSFSVAFVVEPS